MATLNVLLRSPASKISKEKGRERKKDSLRSHAWKSNFKCSYVFVWTWEKLGKTYSLVWLDVIWDSKKKKKKRGSLTYVVLVYLLIKERILMCPMVIISKADHSQNNCQKQNFLKCSQLHQIIVFPTCILSL